MLPKIRNGKEKEISMNFRYVSIVNADRCRMWHEGQTEEWNAADWSNAMVGEAGEACNAVKKYRRIQTGVQQKEGPKTHSEARAAIKKEIGDTYLYLDLLAQFFGFDMWETIRDVFNQVSEREGFAHRLCDDEREQSSAIVGDDHILAAELMLGDVIERLSNQPKQSEQARMMVAALQIVIKKLIEKFELRREAR